MHPSFVKMVYGSLETQDKLLLICWLGLRLGKGHDGMDSGNPWMACPLPSPPLTQHRKLPSLIPQGNLNQYNNRSISTTTDEGKDVENVLIQRYERSADDREMMEDPSMPTKR